jgi:hypothetical protein
MRKIVINNCHGGFGLTEVAEQVLKAHTQFDAFDVPRDNPALVDIVELGNASGQYAKLQIVEIPNRINWHIEEYDGLEHVAEDHQVWYASRDRK